MEALIAGTVTVAVQWANGRTQQRTERLAQHAELDCDLAVGSHAALCTVLGTRRLAVRALTVRFGAVGPQQATLFVQEPHRAARQRLLDAIKRRHGTDAIMWASLLPFPPP